ncbi:MAG: T9SS type A sorting domain-containing protein [Candidatus Eisenbacteria bacterium]|nr:T9SS type A sorting domain-containing protein [Candidatus Eisenbacteria bacterium]
MRPRLLSAALLALAVTVAAAPAARAATITIVNLDGAGEGFNDPTARAPVAGNTGTTLGAQRLNVFNLAASIWGSILSSPITILVDANMDPLFCTSTSAVLGSAGPNTAESDFPGAEFPGTWYTQALANKESGVDQDPFVSDIGAQFNSDVDNSTCLGTRSWYYGFDGNEGTDIEMLPVVLHELGHGLGFLTFVDGTDGTEFFGSPDVFERYMLDNSTGKHWTQMSNAERLASATNDGHLVWDGPAVTFKAPLVLGPRPRLTVNAPVAIAGTYPMGRCAFGASLGSPGLTGPVVLANDGVGTTSDACSALTNGAAVAGKIALVDRSSSCTDLVKAQNVQAAGAAGVLFIDNVVAGSPPTLRGVDPSVTLTAGSVRQSDGNAIRAQLGVGVNVTIGVDPAKNSGADDSHRVLLYAPPTLQGGSSLSHWDVQTFPDLLMEPINNTSLHDNVDLTREAFEDIGWLPRVTAVGPAEPVSVPLRDNAPNPFAGGTTLRFSLAHAGVADLSIYDVSGRLVKRLAKGWLEAGPHALAWNGVDEAGRRAAPGVYLYRLTADGMQSARHMVMLR